MLFPSSNVYLQKGTLCSIGALAAEPLGEDGGKPAILHDAHEYAPLQ